MITTEYVNNLNCNYERILLDKRPEEKRYQYCILNRGGIKGLLPCSLRYINGAAYLYYDISSRQTVSQLYGTRSMTRGWMRDFMWSLKQIQQELGRFLLDMGNILWYPEQVFQDLESNFFSFLYIPYYEGEASFIKLVEFWVEHIDYEDEILVNFVYRMYEQLERNGEVYLQSRIFEDAECLEGTGEQSGAVKVKGPGDGEKRKEQSCGEKRREQDRTEKIKEQIRAETFLEKAEPQSKGRKVLSEELEKNIKPESLNPQPADNEKKAEKSAKEEKKGLFSLLEGKKNRGKKQREEYSMTMQQAMSGYTVAEKTPYEAEDFGRTIFIEEKLDGTDDIHRLYTPDGRLLASLEQHTMSIGKKKEEVDLVLDDASVSRIHARIIEEKGEIYLEDLNSTNGTFKNGLRMQPYEKRKLETGDEIKCGKVRLVFR